MSSTSLYRINAEDCLRMARTAPDERDKPFWLALAQSWLRLAERSARNGSVDANSKDRASGGVPAEQP
jgi:hypothetical protein